MDKKKLWKILGVLALLFYFFFNSFLPIPITCPIYRILHLYCPGCGSTRMIKSIFKGDFYQAFRYNPLLFLFLPFFLFYLIDEFWLKKKKSSFIQKYEPQIWYVLIAIFFVYGILRNLPFFPFLRPTEL